MLITKEVAKEKQNAMQPIFYAKHTVDMNFAGLTTGETYPVFFYDVVQETIYIKNDDGEMDAQDVDHFHLYDEISLIDVLKDKWRKEGLEGDNTLDALLDIIGTIGKDGIEFLLTEWDLVSQISTKKEVETEE